MYGAHFNFFFKSNDVQLQRLTCYPSHIIVVERRMKKNVLLKDLSFKHDLLGCLLPASKRYKDGLMIILLERSQWPDVEEFWLACSCLFLHVFWMDRGCFYLLLEFYTISKEVSICMLSSPILGREASLPFGWRSVGIWEFDMFVSWHWASWFASFIGGV